MGIAVLEARLNDGILLWAEGCDPNGYSSHQVIVPVSAFSQEEQAKFGDKEVGYPWSYLSPRGDSINLGDKEAKDSCEDYDNFKISIKYVDYV